LKELLVDYWPALIVIAQLGLAALMLKVSANTRAMIDAAVEPVKKDLNELEKRVLKTEVRLDDAEGEIARLPSKADLEKVFGEAKAAHAEASAANLGIKRVENHLIGRGLERS